MNLLSQIDENDFIIETKILEDGDELYLTLNEGLGTLALKTKKPTVISSFKNFMKQHPFLTGAAIALGTDALAAYNRNKNLTARFFAQNQYERKLYGDIADQLVKSGQYKMIRKKYINGGLMYELVSG